MVFFKFRKSNSFINNNPKIFHRSEYRVIIILVGHLTTLWFLSTYPFFLPKHYLQ
jgi:hypothetical protein